MVSVSYVRAPPIPPQTLSHCIIYFTCQIGEYQPLKVITIVFKQRCQNRTPLSVATGDYVTLKYRINYNKPFDGIPMNQAARIGGLCESNVSHSVLRSDNIVYSAFVTLFDAKIDIYNTYLYNIGLKAFLVYESVGGCCIFDVIFRARQRRRGRYQRRRYY